MKTVIKDSELEQWHNISESKMFIEQILNRIKENYDVEHKAYRLSQGNYKNFSEEYIPTFRYLEFKYGVNSDLEYRHVGLGNQGFDAEIRIGGAIQTIEIAYPDLGIRTKEYQQQMIDKRSAHKIFDPNVLFEKIKRIIIETANKKARKQYGETLLLIYYPFSEDLYPGDIGLSETQFELMIDELKKIIFGANQVDFFVPGYEYENIFGKNLKPAKLYHIKK